jgi:hypothetical protein
MNRIGKRGESTRLSGGWLLAGSLVLQLACMSGVQGNEPEGVTVTRSAVTFETPEFPISEMPLTIVSVNSGKCLDVPAASTTNGTVIQQYHCNGGGNQTFFFTAAGPDSFQIRLGYVRGKNLEVGNTGLNVHDPIQIDSVVNDRQLFGLVAQSNTTYQIVSKKSGMCLNVPNGSTGDQIPMQQYPCQAGATNELWTIQPTNDAINLVNKNSNKCVDVAGGNFNIHGVVDQATCGGKLYQGWRLATPTFVNGALAYQLIAQHSGLCLDVVGGSTSDGAALQQYPCASPAATNQLWVLDESADDGMVTISSARSGKCVTVPGSSTSDGIGLQQSSCNGGTNQRWDVAFYDRRQIQVVNVAKSDGTGMLGLSDAAITAQVTRLAGAFNRYGAWFSYDPNADKATVNSDALFNLTPGNTTTFSCPDGTLGTPDACAARYAANWPDRLVVYQRPGAPYSSGDTSYIVTGQIGNGLACNNSVADTKTLTREVGHYLGLVNTSFVNGDDLISDTRPDPQFDPCLAPHAPTGTFNGTTVDTNNAMSGYYNDTSVLTRMQSAQARAGEYVHQHEGPPLCGGALHLGCALSTQFCSVLTGDCGATALGTCMTPPTACSPNGPFACGCDGVTYGNDCEAHAAGVNVLHEGGC